MNLCVTLRCWFGERKMSEMPCNYRISILCVGFYKHEQTSTNTHNKCMYKLLHILCVLKILIKAVSYDSHSAARKMSKLCLLKHCERAMPGPTTFQPRRS